MLDTARSASSHCRFGYGASDICGVERNMVAQTICGDQDLSGITLPERRQE